MPKGYDMISPAMVRTGYHLHATDRLPDVPVDLRPQLYPGRDTNVFGGVSPDQLPQVLDAPIDFVPLPGL